MAVACLKCFIEGVVQGGTLMPDPDQFRLDFAYAPDSDGEVEGERSISFVSDVVTGNPADGYSVSGTLQGNFGVNPDNDIRSPATAEIYHRDGALAAVHITVERDGGGVSFMAALQPARDADAEGAVRGFAFLGWSDQEDRPQE